MWCQQVTRCHLCNLLFPLNFRSAARPLTIFITLTSGQNPKVHGAKIQMASMVRHAENKIKLKPNEVLAGRLSESQINEIFHDLR